MIEASGRFCESFQGGGEGSKDQSIHVEVETWKEMEVLHRIIRVAQEEGDYCSRGGLRMKMEDLLPIILVARKFKFHECLKQCGARVEEGISAEEATTLLMGVPACLFQEPDIAALLESAAAGIMQSHVVGGQDMLFCIQPTAYASLDHVRITELLPLRPALLALPPHVFATVIRARRRLSPRVSDNAFYTAIRCYLDQYVQEMDEASKLGAFKQLAMALFFPRSALSAEYVGFTVSTCPYMVKSGMLSKAVAAALSPRVDDAIRWYRHDTRVELPLARLLSFVPNQKQYIMLTAAMGFPILLCVERRAMGHGEDLFALYLVALCSGTAASRGAGQFQTMPFYVCGDVNGDGGEVWWRRVGKTVSALVLFVQDDWPAPRSPFLGSSWFVNEVIFREGASKYWKDVVKRGGPYFSGEGETMRVRLSLNAQGY